MREIKFRAWDKESKKMIYSNEVNKEPGSEEYYFSLSEDSVELLRYDKDYSAYVECNAEIMQYTGLKDKNGKEIYEGDIVDYFKEELGIVGFISGCFVIDSKSYTDSFLELMGDIKVIGNIYENPELLG